MVTKADLVLHLDYVRGCLRFEQGLDVELGLKWGEILDRLPRADELNRNSQLCLNGQGDTALRAAIHLCHNLAGDSIGLTNYFRLSQRSLSSCSIDD